MKDRLYDATQFIFSLVEKAMANSITFSGEEHLDKKVPTLFVANHFTRLETFLFPYILYKKLDFHVSSLADPSVFQGLLGEYLSAAGTVSTKDKDRNEKILGDLLTGRNSWMIYPEGSMIKSKKVLLDKDKFLVQTQTGLHEIFTGAAVLALKSEMLKIQYLEFQNNCDIENMQKFKEKYFLGDDEKISYYNTHIIPVNISYTPIGKGKNSLVDFANKYIDDISDKLNEEIDIESNLLLSSQFHLHFSKAIDVKDYLLKSKRALQKQEIDTDDESLIQKIKVPFINLMMDEVYKNILITFEHVFALSLEYLEEREFTLDELKRRIYLISRELKKSATYSVNMDLHANIYTLLNDEPHKKFDDVFALSIEENILENIEGDIYKVNTKNFKNEYTFHTIRIKNILRVLINETMILEELHSTIKHQIHKDLAAVNKEVFYTIYNRDKKEFKYDYNKFYSVLESKPKEVGEPFILYDEKNTIGCVISHGYKSGPKEIKPLAQYLFKHGINVYAVRLKGHGTMPEDLRDVTYKEWYDSFDVGYAALRGVSKKLYLCGFSTGGLLALLKASNVTEKVDGIICINSAISLQDIRVKYLVPTLNILNNFLSMFNADMDTYESEPEHPEINYKKHYLTSIGELKKLIDVVNERLQFVSEATFIIQGDNDPIVDPKSADMIYESIASSKKEKYVLHSDKHVITLAEDIREDFFEKIIEFIRDKS
ncbi:alpha/beta hydrolase [Sulfurimonas sp. SAG-AH-194-C21]|nr:alpha/beta hydrolase [Sulfurimonas sp. SAG-AH-194-C21]MDF1882672.1 alpha/beta hydrolase [Sulfurimonas sp. SAG-AH-194-C21]